MKKHKKGVSRFDDINKFSQSFSVFVGSRLMPIGKKFMSTQYERKTRCAFCYCSDRGRP